MQNDAGIRSADEVKDFSGVIKIDEDQVKDHLGSLVRRTVEETMNDMLDTEARQLCNAGRYERSEARNAQPRTRHTRLGF